MNQAAVVPSGRALRNWFLCSSSRAIAFGLEPTDNNPIFLSRRASVFACSTVCLERVMAASASERLRAALAAGPIMVPGVFNALVARMAEQIGFPSIYLSGGALSAAAGVPDIGLLTLAEFVEQARAITAATSIPLLSDADTGFGETV